VGHISGEESLSRGDIKVFYCNYTVFIIIIIMFVCLENYTKSSNTEQWTGQDRQQSTYDCLRKQTQK